MRRSLLVLVLATLLGASGTIAPASAEAQTLIPDVPALVGGGSDTDDKKSDKGPPCGQGVALICAGTTLIDGAAGAVGDVASGAAGAAGDAVLGGVVDWASAGAAWLVREIGTQIDRSTRPAIGSSWFSEQYASARSLAIALSLLFLLAAVVHALVRQDLRLLAYSVLVALPLAMLLMFAAVVLVELALGLTDWMTARAMVSFGDDAQTAFERLGEQLQPAALSGNPLPGLVMFFAAALTAVLALVVWIELVLREASIYVAVCFLPIAFTAMVWKPTSGWARQLAEWLAAIILAKFTIALAFAIAGSALSHSAGSRSGGLTSLLAGCAVLLVAAFTPWVLLRMLPGSSSASHGMHRGVVRQAAGSAVGVSTASAVTRQAMLRAFTPAAPVAAAAAQAKSGGDAGGGRPPDPPRRDDGPRLDPPARRTPAQVR